jgi:23S rRNA (adenine2030-N6)-methyltransferase
MNYRHAFHAGNFADVAKHLALVSVLAHLKKKETPFAVIDTHAGRGVYDLAGEASARTGEAEAGVARLRGLAATEPSALEAYLELAGDAARYPGSPLIAARMLRANDRLIAIEKHPEEFAALKTALYPFARARAVEGDGFALLAGLLPPQERRGLVLIDPPYESGEDFAAAARAVAAAMKRFATGIVMVWFPVKSKAEADGFCGEVLASGVTKALRIDVSVEAVKSGDKERLSSAGLLVINPPFGLDRDMATAFDVAGPLLQAQLDIVRLAGD